ncbi:ABC transporter substrate-binding protein [Marinisporobacter balticus]|uniref:Carbohydrate ABC transporter substrate-binding protein (CUT1 family) n=1 Tax=Marinisporobacter balticus TaxID=2018667 RepID=A0A4V6NP92_9FIRM|nr:sugar ABC transporter substrate-binding protein [Marinisporobacter balticus]TCO70720.1 carbohydrate ABC transporter substrate-binding protein (CUT1 family) [Marinisporobacter balticus]
MKRVGFCTFFLCLLLCTFIIFGPFYFIENRVSNRTDDTKEEGFKGVITLWDYPYFDIKSGTRYGWILSKIKVFERENPGVYIELKPLNVKTGIFELETAIKTQTYPDIAPVGSDYSIIHQKVLMPIDEYLNKKELADYKKQALDAVQFEGKTWGFPWMMTTYTLFLNKDLFNEKGVSFPKDGDWTYDEFVKKMKKLTYDQDNDGKMDVYGFNSFMGVNDYNTWGILLSDGAKIFDEKNLSYAFNDKRAISGLKKLADLKLVHKVTPNNFGENSEQEAWESFYKEKKVAVYPTGTWAVNALNKLRNEGAGFEFTVANYPIGAMGKSVAICKNTSAYGIFRQEDKKKLEMCVKFLKFVSAEVYQKELDRLGVFPVKKSVGEIYKKDPIMSNIEKNLETTQNIPQHPNWIKIDGILQSQFRQVLLENKSLKDALKDAEKKIKTYNEVVKKMDR